MKDHGLRASVITATGYAMGTAILLSAWVAVVRLVEGPLSEPVWFLVLTYFVAGAVLGPVLGVLLPFADHPGGAAAIGAIGLNGFLMVSFFVLEGDLEMFTGPWALEIITVASIVGALVGLALRAVFKRLHNHL